MKSKVNRNPINSKNTKLLIVEDNDDQWQIIQLAMRQDLGQVTIERASSVQQALSLLNEWENNEWEMPKLILSDLYMPDNVDGWQLVRQIKAMATPIRRIPIVMLTSSDSATDIEQAYSLGIAAYMVKPVNFEGWLTCFREVRTYWLETTTLLPLSYEF